MGVVDPLFHSSLLSIYISVESGAASASNIRSEVSIWDRRFSYVVCDTIRALVLGR